VAQRFPGYRRNAAKLHFYIARMKL